MLAVLAGLGAIVCVLALIKTIWWAAIPLVWSVLATAMLQSPASAHWYSRRS